MRFKLAVTTFLVILCAACSSKNSESTTDVSTAVTLKVSTHRLNATQFEVLFDSNGLSGFDAKDLSLQVTSANASAWTAGASSGVFKTTITSSLTSGEIPYTVTWKLSTYSRKAVILPNLDSAWDQPEAVPGFVNTDGWEDSPEISPDGKYLILSTYSPVSLFQCLLDGSLRTTASCNQNSFATYSSYRPNFPGASRVLSPTSIDHTISFLSPADTTNAFPPVSSYLFEIDSSGSFVNPKPIYVDWEAYTWGAPFGFHFRKQISSTVYQLYVSFGDPILGNGNQLQKVQLDFSGSVFPLGTISRISGTLTKSNWQLNPLTIGNASNQAGNPGTAQAVVGADGYLFWDDESRSSGQREIFYATETANGTFGNKTTTGLANPGIVDKYQPFFNNGRLYYSANHQMILSQAMTNTADPSSSSSWGSARLEIGIDSSESHSGRITAVGEPSLATDADGAKWLYFAYAVSRSGQNLDLNIGRVRAK